MPYIKEEAMHDALEGICWWDEDLTDAPDDETQMTVIQKPLTAAGSSLSSRGGYLSKKSKELQRSEMYYWDNFSEDRVFETTVGVRNGHMVVKVTHAMFDTGASSSFISADVVEAAGLVVHHCTPKSFRIADGRSVVYNRCAEFKLYMGGVRQWVTAYVKERYTGYHLVIGAPTMRQFRAGSAHGCGPKQETRWSVAQDERGMRTKRYLLTEDDPFTLPTFRLLVIAKG